MRTAKLLGVFVVVLSTLIFLSGISYSDPLDNWHWRNPVPTGNDLTAIAYGNGIFVAVGTAGTILTSPDGVTWITRISGVTSKLLGVIHGNGTFVAVGENGTILTSQDGVTWTKRVSGITSALFGVTYGNNIFVAVGRGSDECGCPQIPIDPLPPCSPCPAIILTSPDGINWTSKTLGPVEFGLTGVTYGNGIFIAFGSYPPIFNPPYDSIFTSSNGVDWSPIPGHLAALTFGDGIFIGIGLDYKIRTSPDGVTWAIGTSVPFKDFSYFHSITFGNGTIVAVDDNGTILTSSDGVTWTESSVDAALIGVTYGDNIFIAIGGRGSILTSPDGMIWTKRTSDATSYDLNTITYGNGLFLAGGDHSTILTSPDAVTWIQQDPGLSFDLLGATYSNGTFVAVGDNCPGIWSGTGDRCGIISTSPNGVDWTTRSQETYFKLCGVIRGNSTFVAVGQQGTILTSPDGVTWTKRDSDATYEPHLFGVTYSNGIFVTVGGTETILTSPDGVTWTQRNQGVGGVSDILFTVTYGNGTFVTAGGKGTILTSPDGVTWTKRTSGVSDFLYAVTYVNGTFVAAGGNGTILTSPDGVTWTKRTSGLTSGVLLDLNGITHGNGTFVAVGTYGTIIQSDPIQSDPLAPQISVSPAFLDFGNVNAGSYSEKSITIRNDGGDNLLIGTITSPASPFSKASDNCSGATLAPGKDCTVTYRFSPTSADTFSSSSNIPSNDPSKSVVTISLSGIGEYITLSTPLNNTSINACSLYSLPAFSWGVGDAFRTLELQFSSDQNFSSIPVKVSVAGDATEAMVNSYTWKKVLSIPGASGGTVHWRVVGTRANRTTAISDVRSIIIEPAQPVTNPTI